MSTPFKFTRAELVRYFDRIHLPPSAQKFSAPSSSGEQLEYLALLQKHHLMAIPFENLTLHYSWHRVVDLSPDHLYDKIVCQKGRGGYCMENNSLFHHLLVSLGFDVYMAGARIYDPLSAAFHGFSHCLNMIRIGDAVHAVDVGYGGNGPVSPVKLIHEQVHEHIGGSSIRVRHDSIPQARNKDTKVWILEHQLNSSAAWLPLYCFPDTEFFLEDIASISWSPRKSSTSFFRKKVVCVRFTGDAEAETMGEDREVDANGQHHGKLDGVLILDHNLFKWRRNGVKMFERELQSEDERLEALERFFGIHLSDQDKRAIRGTVGEIPDKTKLNSTKEPYPGSLMST